jgi:hypothetical protein
MHKECYDFMSAWARILRPRSIVEIGSLNVNGSTRDLFPGIPYTGIDLLNGAGVDIVADGATWRPDDGQLFDLVICTEVLEHAENPAALCRNLVQLGRTVLVTAAGPLRPPHGRSGGPLPRSEYYRNITTGDLATWLRADCVTVLTEETGEDVRGVALRQNV